MPDMSLAEFTSVSLGVAVTFWGLYTFFPQWFKRETNRDANMASELARAHTRADKADERNDKIYQNVMDLGQSAVAEITKFNADRDTRMERDTLMAGLLSGMKSEVQELAARFGSVEADMKRMTAVHDRHWQSYQESVMGSKRRLEQGQESFKRIRAAKKVTP